MKGALKYYIAIPMALALLLLLSGCGAAVKKCQDPQLTLPETIIPGRAADSLCMADMDWSEIFSDPVLTELIRKTLENNRDMLAASARVKELERLHRVRKADQLPSLGARAYANQENYDYTYSDAVEDPEIGLKATLSWEVDLFGRLKWASRAALAEYLSSIESQRALQMTLVAAVSTAYFELIALDNELNIVMRTLETRKENIRQAKLRFDGGLTTEMPFRQSEVEYAAAAALVPDLRKDIALKEHEIALLAGEFPSVVERSQLNTQDKLPDLLKVGLPSTLLQRRPDLMVAEQELKEAMAQVGVSWADRFPRLNLTLTGGVENNTFVQFFSGSFLYGAAELVSPLFSFGKRKARYEAAIQAYEQKRYNYEQKVLEVFKDVNDAVSNYTASRETVTLLTNLKEAAAQYVTIAIHQYRNGYINYIDVLDAQRSYFNAEIDYSNAVRDEYLAIIDLYKALGGGW